MKTQVFTPVWAKHGVARIIFLTGLAFSLSLIVSLDGFTATGRAKDRDKRGPAENVEVKNFGKVNDHLYRGGQPEEDEYHQLAAKGIKTVIDLREDARSKSRMRAKDAGLNYINIRLNDKRPPTKEESNLFLSLVKDQSNWPVFVHCAGGRHRTGVLIAVYRMEIDGWNVRQAYEEMKDYKFYSRFGHDEMKDYVYDYYRMLSQRRIASGSVMTTSAARVRRVSEQSR
jgi:protein tyrosine/serine phosphatase